MEARNSFFLCQFHSRQGAASKSKPPTLRLGPFFFLFEGGLSDRDRSLHIRLTYRTKEPTNSMLHLALVNGVRLVMSSGGTPVAPARIQHIDEIEEVHDLAKGSAAKSGLVVVAS